MATRQWVELGEYIDLRGMPDRSLAVNEAA